MKVRDELELLERLANEQGLMLSDELINFAVALAQIIEKRMEEMK